MLRFIFSPAVHFSVSNCHLDFFSPELKNWKATVSCYAFSNRKNNKKDSSKFKVPINHKLNNVSKRKLIDPDFPTTFRLRKPTSRRRFNSAKRGIHRDGDFPQTFLRVEEKCMEATCNFFLGKCYGTSSIGMHFLYKYWPRGTFSETTKTFPFISLGIILSLPQEKTLKHEEIFFSF